MKPTKQSRIFIAFLTLLLLPGLYAGVMGITHVRNYNQPLLFFIILVVPGFITGYYLFKFLKPYAKFNKKQLAWLWLFRMFMMLGLAGIFFGAGGYINKSFSCLVYQENCVVVNKTEVGAIHRRRPGANYLFVRLKGSIERLNVSSAYWAGISTGDRIPVQIYESKLGFDFIELKDEQ